MMRHQQFGATKDPLYPWQLYLILLAAFIYFLGRQGYARGLYPLYVSDGAVFLALALVGTSGYWIFQKVSGGIPLVTWLTVLGAVLLLAGHMEFVLNGVPESNRLIHNARAGTVISEMLLTLGVALFVLAFLATVRATKAGQDNLQTEQDTRYAGIVANLADGKKLETGREAAFGQVERRVQQRTAELGDANRRLQDEIDERRKIEEALQTSQKWYHALADAAQDVIFIINADDYVEYVNAAAANALDLPVKDIVGRKRSELFPEPLGSLQGERLREVFESGKPIRSENRGHHPSRELWYDTRLVPIKSESGAPVAILGISRDVTERKNSEQALRESEQRYRAVVEEQTELVYRALPDTTLTFVNDAYCRYFGKQRQDLLGKPFLVMVPETIHGEIAEHIEYMAKEKKAAIIEHEVFRESGEIRWVQWSNRPIIGGDGKLAEFQGMGRDVTERRRAQHALKESEEKYRHIIEGLHEAVFRIELPDVLSYISPAAKEFFGLNPEQMLREDFRIRDFIHPDSLKFYDEIWAGICKGVCPNAFEYKIVDVDGNERWLVQSNRLIHDEHGIPVAVEGICREITEQKRAQEVVEEHRARLQEAAKMSILGEMAAGIAHEINNPLNIISGSAEQVQNLLKESPVSRETLQHLAEVIVRHVFRVKEIITGLRHYTRDESEDPLRPTRVRSIIDDVAGLWRVNVTLRDIALSVEGPATDLFVDCRPTQLMQVLANLLSNATHAVEGRPEKWIRIAAGEADGQVEISVTDSGPGISPEIAPVLFRPHTTSKLPGKGTGLGLAISRRIIENHNGTLELDKTSAHTRFTIRIPAGRPPDKET